MGDAFVDVKWLQDYLMNLMELKEHFLNPDEFDGMFGGLDIHEIAVILVQKNEEFDSFVKDLLAQCAQDRRDGVKELGVLIDYNGFYRQF